MQNSGLVQVAFLNFRNKHSGISFHPPAANPRPQILDYCQEHGPEDGVDPRETQRLKMRRAVGRSQANRKALQLCRQVERTVALVLSSELNDDRLRDLLVLAVVPAPQSNHLLITLQAPVTLTPDELLSLDAVLLNHKSQIRSAIATDINRRKTPDVTLRIVDGI